MISQLAHTKLSFNHSIGRTHICRFSVFIKYRSLVIEREVRGGGEEASYTCTRVSVADIMSRIIQAGPAKEPPDPSVGHIF